MKPAVTIAIAAVVLLLLVVAAVVVFVIVQRRRKQQAAAAAIAASGKPDPAAAVQRAFDDADARLREKVPGQAARDAIPRVLVLGEPGAGKTTLLGATSLNTSLHKADDPQPGDGAALHVWTFDKAIVFDPRGDAFLTDKGEAPDPPAALDALVSVLKKSRSERPLDAILLTIPCTDLDPHGPGTDEDRKRKATSLHKQLGDIQRKLGVSVPVYVLVTKCDALPSFQSFCREVGGGRRDAILGWSRPDASGPIEAARAADAVAHDFVGETMASLEQRLSARQVGRFLAGAREPGAAQKPAGQRLGATDGLFLFPSELRLIADPLRVYVDEIFIPSVYDEPFELRGIYFCGDSGMSAAAAPTAAAVTAPAPAAATRGVFFVRNLFKEKILPETSLARPSAAADQGRRRLILGLQIAAIGFGVVFGAGLTLTLTRLREEAVPIQACLDHVLAGLERQKAPDKPAADAAEAERRLRDLPDEEELKHRSVELFSDLAGIHTEHMTSAFVPLSYVSLPGDGLDARLERGLKKGYRHIILKAFDAWLGRQEDKLVKEEPKPWRNPALQLSLETSPEFVLLDGWLQQLKIFERELGNYNCVGTVPKSGEPPACPDDRGGEVTDEEAMRRSETRLRMVAELADYLLGYKAEPGFYTDSRYYRSVLGHGVDGAEHKVSDDRRLQVIGRANALFKDVFEVMRRVYREDIISKDIKDLQRGFDALQAGGSADEPYTVRDLDDLRAAIKRTEDHIAEPLLSWIPTKVPPPQPGLERLFDDVGASKLLRGESTMSDLRGQAERELYNYPVAVEQARTDVTRDLLKHKGDTLAEMALSDEVTAFKKPIDDLLGQGFMRARPEDLAAEIPDPKESMRWDIDRLKEAEALVKEYDAFVAAGQIKRFRAVRPDVTEAVQENVNELAQRQLVALLKSHIRRAVLEEPTRPAKALTDSALEERTKEHVENLRLASGPLREVAGAFMRFHRDPERDRLGALIRIHGNLVLDEAYGLLAAERLYQIAAGPFEAWNKGGTPAYEAFGVTDAAGLVEVLAGYRTTASAIAKSYAEPVVDLLDSSEVAGDKKATSPSIKQWRGVLKPLQDWEGKKPDNSVAAIERFVTTNMPEIKLSNCLERTEAADTMIVKDFFTAKKRKILKDLRAQCSIVVKDPQMRQQYRLLRIEFNSRIAGRFPFAPRGQATRADDAPPDAVRDFLKKANDFRDNYYSVLSHQRGEGPREVVTFLNAVRDVSAFLVPMWAQSDSAADGACDLSVEFRANPAHEIGGNEIAEWALAFPEDKLTYGGPPKQSAHWRMSDTVRLALRWAKNSPDIPTAQQDDGGIARDRWVTFEGTGPLGTGPWALLRLMAAHLTTVRDAAGAVDASATYLGFRVQTKIDAGGGFVDPVGPGPNEARVFLRLVLTANKTTLPRYPIFPTEAPDYSLE